MSGYLGKRLLATALLVLCWMAPADSEAKKKGKKNQVEPVPVRCYDVAVQGSTVYLAQTAGVSLWDISDISRPRHTHSLELRATVVGVVADPPYLYLAASRHGLIIAELGQEGEEGEGGAPTVVSRFDTPGSVRQLVLTDHYALLADDRYGVRVVDIADPERPLQKAQVNTRDRAVSIALRGGLLATAEASAGVRVIDVRRPERPLELHALREVRDARDVAFVDDLLLVAAGKQGLVVFEMDGDARPRLRGSLAIDRSADFVDGAGGFALLSNGTPALQLVSIADPAEPVFVDSLRVHRSAPVWRVHLEGPRAYAALDQAGLTVIDMTHLAMPEVLLPRERRLKILWPDDESGEDP